MVPVEVLKTIEESAEVDLEQKNYKEALWKYEHCVLYIRNYFPAFNIRHSRATIKCATILVKIAAGRVLAKDLPGRLQCLDKAKMFCKECLQLGVTEYLAEAYKCKADCIAEAFELQKAVPNTHNNEPLHEAYDCYKKSFEIEKTVSTLFKMIITCINSRSDATELMKYQQFLTSGHDRFHQFAKTIATSKQVTNRHMKFFFVKERFCLIATELSTDLSGEVLSRILEACWKFKFEQAIHRIWEHANDRTKMTVVEHLVKKNKELPTFLLAVAMTKELLEQACITPNIRTSYLLNRIEATDIGPSYVAIQSGPIKDQDKNISKLVDCILTSETDYDLSFLKCADIKLTSTRFTSLVEKLSHKCCQRKADKKKAVRALTDLIELGANMEGLNRYSQGNKTSPLIVATHLALKTGNTDILLAVVERKSSSWVTEDVNGNSPLQIAERSSCECKDDVIELLRVAGFETQEVHPSPKPEDNCRDDDHTNCAAQGTSEQPATTSISHEASQNVQLTKQGSSKPKRKKKPPKVKVNITKEASDEPETKHVSEKNENISIPDLQLKVCHLLSSEKSYCAPEESQGVPQEREQTIARLSTQNILPQTEVGHNTPGDKPQETDKETFNFEDQLWAIEIRENVDKFMRDKAQPHKIRQQFIKKLHKLASGDWNEKLHKPIVSENDIKIFEAKLTKAARIMYQIDVRFCERLTNKIQKIPSSEPIHIYTQTIIVWDVVLDHDRINRTAERIKQAIKKLTVPTDIFPFRTEGLGQGIVYPQMYVTPELDATTQSEVIKQLGQNFESKSKIQEYDVGAKMYSVTNDLILSFLDQENDRKDYPIKATDEEHDIIMLPTKEPVIVLGRSGTGKTTTCLNRLWLNFRNYWKEPDRLNQPIIVKPTTQVSTQTPTTATANERLFPQGASISVAEESDCSGEMPSETTEKEFEHLHQMFITKNPALCMKMKKRFYDFVAGSDFTKYHLAHENEALPETFSDIEHFPVFLTYRQFFTMLDRSIGDGENYLKPGVEGIESLANQADTHSLNLLFDVSDDDSDEEEDNSNEPRQKRKIHVRKEVTAHEFSAEIWPKIAKHWSDSKVDVDPILIWTEIQSFIEGSTQALETEEGFLSEEDYIKLGTKQASNFPFRREVVYKLFLEYKQEIKHRNMSHQFDNSEFIWQLNKRLEAKGLDNIPWSIHELYVDEAQDFTQAELTVILKCCQDPNRSFLAGDTAQTIIKGISFRFEDLKSLFRGLKLPGVKCKAPSIRKLTTNHRSHSGITNLAISLTEVLKEHFRYSFDWNNIPNDHSNIRGPKPLFICSKSKLENFLIQSQKASDVSSIEFGADQVVIARNSSEEGKKTMPEYLQHEIVLNPQECKGLEFNDVLLYNFFTDTASQNEDLWRIPASYLVEHPEVASREEFETDVHPIQFDETCHKSLCAELKMLYTIVTRAKRYIWIYEDSTLDKVPMFEYWYKRDLIEIVTESARPDEHQTPSSSSTEDLIEIVTESARPDEHQTPSLLASSSTEPDEHQTLSLLASSSIEDWKRQGDIYMEKRLWQQAKKCYQKAGESSLQNIAHAHALEQRALRAKKTDTSQFRAAAAMLIDCCKLVPRKDLVHNAAICLYRAKMHTESIKLFERIQEYTFALRICKEHNSKDMVTMVRLYEKKGRYKALIKLYLGREKYEEALKQAHRCIEEGLLEKSVCYKMLKEVAYKQIKKGLQSQNHSEEDLIKFVDFIPHVSEQIHFLKQAKLYKRACELLQKHDMHRSAYRICKAQHLYAEGINIADSLGTDHAHHKHSLILTQAEYKLAKKDTDLRRQVKGDLEQFLGANHLSTHHKARAYLLLSAILVIDNEQNCLKHCIETHAMYKTVAKSKAGEIEAFYILNEVREHTVDHGKVTVATIEATEQICTLLEKPAAVFTPEINDIEHFYGLEKDGNELYCVSKESSCFLNFDGTEMDSDGMLRLNKKIVLRQVQEHYKQHIAKWKESIQKVKNPWETKVKRSFTFHSELLQLPYLKKAHRMFPPGQIKEYLNMTDLAIQFGQLNPSVFVPNDIIENLHKLLSPFSQISLPFKQENYVHIATLSSTKVALMDKVSKDNTAMATDMKTPNVDNWLQLWKIIHIMDRKRTDQLNYTIKKQEKMVNEEVRLQNGYYDPSRSSPFTYTYRKRENTYQSIFDLWDHSCKLYRGKSKALVATRISFTLFIQVIARRRSLNKTFSLENLIYITTIQSTALLAMISASLFKSSQPKVMVVPESFELMINNFDLINTGSTQTGLLDACLNTSNQLSVHTVLQKASELLIGIIDLLTGTYNYRYFPLNEAVCQGTDTEAIHCLVLTLTIFGNLLLNGLLSPEKVRSIFQIIIYVLQKSKDGTASQRVCLAFASCTNTKDLFQKVVHPLLRDIDLNLMLLQTVSIIGKQRIRIKSSLPSQIPTAEFKWKTPTQPDSAINSQREPKQMSQEAGTLPESSNTTSEETYQQDQDQSNGEDRAVVDRTISLEQDESEDEDVQEELSAAAQMQYKPEPKPSEKLQKEMSQCKHGNRCIICDEPVEDDRKHFEEAKHKDKKTGFDEYTVALITYNSTQGHLVEVIEKCRKNNHSNYELESMTLNAEELIRSNKEDISQVGQDCSWKQRADKVSKLRDITQKVIANLDKKHKETFEQQKANTELSDEDRSEEDEKITEVLSKVKLTSKRRTKIRKN